MDLLTPIRIAMAAMVQDMVQEVVLVELHNTATNHLDMALILAQVSQGELGSMEARDSVRKLLG